MAVSMRSLLEEATADVQEWIDDHKDEKDSAFQSRRDQAVEEIVRAVVPCMTTCLFQLAVEDNALAFEDVDTETETTPFAILFEAVAQRLLREVHEHLDVEVHAD